MASITIRNLDDDVKTRLRVRAAGQGHSMEEEVRLILADEDMDASTVRDQVSRYWGRYRLVLVTNQREFSLVGPDASGAETTLETFCLTDSDDEFTRRLESPRTFAREMVTGLGEYLARALSHRAALAEPKDLAWLLASYARDGLARVEAAGDAPSLKMAATLHNAVLRNRQEP